MILEGENFAPEGYPFHSMMYLLLRSVHGRHQHTYDNMIQVYISLLTVRVLLVKVTLANII